MIDQCIVYRDFQRLDVGADLFLMLEAMVHPLTLNHQLRPLPVVKMSFEANHRVAATNDVFKLVEKQVSR